MDRNGNDLQQKKKVSMLTFLQKYKKKTLQLQRVPNNTNKSLRPKGVIQYRAPGSFGLVRFVLVTLATSQSATWLNPVHTRQKTFLNLCQFTAHPRKMSIVLLPSPIAAFLRG